MGTPILTKQMDSLYNRLGFDAWADNVLVNIIEDAQGSTSGTFLSADHDDFNISATWDEKTVTCVIRAYTESGWQTYEKQTNR